VPTKDYDGVVTIKRADDPNCPVEVKEYQNVFLSRHAEMVEEWTESSDAECP